MANQTQNSVNRSVIALGLGFSQWTRNDLSVILNHYGVRPAIEDSNNTLIDKLNQLALERGLMHVDRLAILKAQKAGLRLPPRKPLNAASPPAITHTEEYTSGASDDSDIEVSDDELAEELLSLSEEERDLREYTATMSLPRSSKQCRTLRPRSAANPIANRPMSTSLPVRHRSAAQSRPVHSTLSNRSVTARTRIPSHVRHPGSAVANRAVPTSSLRLRGLARPQVVNHTMSTQANNILSSLSKLRKLTVIFNDVARRDASPASNVSLKIRSCIVKNVATVRASIAISKCITACHAARKLRSVKSPSSVESLPLRNTSKSELKSARVAALLPRRQAVVITLHAKGVATNTVGSVLRTTDLSTKKGMNTMPQIANTTPTIFEQQ
ncbi:MAG: hypothetical protein ALECFALPRED_010141 [Alectoria fallacina]|uniref:Uncharacterized protein n=1 Tax=Alectoria fallacina TaxID=1903189 RepID=A0A8H3J8U8_9LECA|nr:MAG: hypothetical protein ALECFALPRED_010141 [Alectoria fallacina]